MTPLVLVAGTWGWHDDGTIEWNCPGHPFGRFLAAQGIRPQYDGRAPFIWSTDLDGVPWLGSRKRLAWAAGGAALAYFADGQKLHVIAHSHALQVAAFAALEHRQTFGTLITVGSPLRADLRDAYTALRQQTDYWLHVHSDQSDRMEWLGELFDGHFGVVRDTPLADRNDQVPHVGHSDLLYRPELFHYWIDRGWLKTLTMSTPAGV